MHPRGQEAVLRRLRQVESATVVDVVDETFAAPAPVGSWRLEILRLQPLLIELVALLSLTGVAALAFGRGLRAGTVYDEGVYLASLDALEHGQKLGSEVFASQAPGFYALLEAQREIFGGSIVAMRVAMLLIAVVGCIAAYYVGRCIAGPRGGFFAMALLVTSSSVDDEAIRIRADLPSVVLSLVAFALALFAVRRKGAARLVAATLAGGALAAAVSVKLLAVAAVVPVLAIVLRRPARPLAVAFGAGAVGVAVALVAFYATVLGPLWNDVVRFHLKAQSAHIHGAPRDFGGNLAKVAGAITGYHGLLSPFPWLVLVGGAATLLAWRRRQLLDALPLWLWVAASGALLAWHRPLWAHDAVLLTVSLAVASGVGLATLMVNSRVVPRAVAAGCVVLIAATLVHHVQETFGGESPGIKWAAEVLRNHTTSGSKVASDLPIIPFLADRRQPGTLVDTSWTRLGSGWLTRAEVLRTIDRDHVSAVVVGHNFAADPKLLRALRVRFPVVLRTGGVSLPGEGRVEVRIYLPG